MRAIELFKLITAVPRCSGTHEPFIKFMKEFSKNNKFLCEIDDANNILCYKKEHTPRVCLQSHYDIVCLEEGKIPQIKEEDGYLKAEDSTLGADNGIGCAYMLSLMEEDVDAEYLFTCDEEIGLIGANNIKHELQSSYMLNLDSEMEGEICIGCAGGVDIFALTPKGEYCKNTEGKTMYEIEIKDLDGGHSGVDIDKNIPNAIKLIAKTIKECGGEILDINGGERINSIPKRAKAIILTDKTPASTHPNMSIKKINEKTVHYKQLDKNILEFLYTFSNGVRAYDKELGVVQSSINLAIVENTIEGVKISLSARSMDNEELKTIKRETTAMLELFGFEISTDGKYPAWKPSHSQFNEEVLNTYKKFVPEAQIKAIHAGLECAIFKDRYPHIQVCSIGPNIYNPHSLRERCEISSVHKLYDITKEIIGKINSH